MYPNPISPIHFALHLNHITWHMLHFNGVYPIIHIMLHLVDGHLWFVEHCNMDIVLLNSCVQEHSCLVFKLSVVKPSGSLMVLAVDSNLKENFVARLDAFTFCKSGVEIDGTGEDTLDFYGFFVFVAFGGRDFLKSFKHAVRDIHDFIDKIKKVFRDNP